MIFRCPYCSGSGKNQYGGFSGGEFVGQPTICYACSGEGKISAKEVQILTPTMVRYKFDNVWFYGDNNLGGA